ncbi:hypothetical protein LPJ75_004378 [Coemansia sp. RSA 2598]|nr:hypothetical protein LPJ75_004378 [Coemansia sp. RSA 2598]
MAYRKRSLDLPIPGDSTKHARNVLDGSNSNSNKPVPASRPRNSQAVPDVPSAMTAGGPQLPPIRSLNELTFTSRSPNSAADSAAVFAPNNPTTIPSLRHLHTPADQAHGYLGGHPRQMLPPPPSQQQQQQMLQSDAKSTESLDTSDLVGSADVIKVARNWSRDETLSLVRAIGRHYDSLKRCKTNQERSNVWHRIHKEHSSQFPGRSKKASQDRWGKVLSDYKDVMIHNKEKGAARWTFDFFKEVANIVDGDPQFMEVSSPSTLSPPSTVAGSGGGGGATRTSMSDDYHGHPPAAQPFMYAAGPSTLSGSMGIRPPYTYHRMSEPNLSIRTQQIQQGPGVSTGLSAAAAAARPLASASGYQKKKPVVLEAQSAGIPQGCVFGLDVVSRDHPGRPASSSTAARRTSYPQMQMHLQRSSAIMGGMGRGGGGGGKPVLPEFSPPPPPHHPHPPVGSQQQSSSGTLSCIMNYSMDPQPLSHGLSALPDTKQTSSDTPLSVSGHENPEKACRYALEMLELQMRRIDAQQEELCSLRKSTRDTIAKVEQIMDYYTRD